MPFHCSTEQVVQALISIDIWLTYWGLRMAGSISKFDRDNCCKRKLETIGTHAEFSLLYFKIVTPQLIEYLNRTYVLRNIWLIFPRKKE